MTCTALDISLVFVRTGNVRISDLGLAVELADDQLKIKGYAGTPGTVEIMITKLHPHLQNPALDSIYLPRSVVNVQYNIYLVPCNTTNYSVYRLHSFHYLSNQCYLNDRSETRVVDEVLRS